MDKNFISDTFKPDKRLVSIETLLEIMYLGTEGKFVFIKAMKNGDAIQ